MKESTKQIEGERTTVMLRNLPSFFTRDMLLELLKSLGFANKYDFVYLPTDVTVLSCLGYAFVNLRTHEDALQVFENAHGFTDWERQSSRVLAVSWSTPLQGLAAQIQRYRNSHIMHPRVPDQCRPLIFGENGERIPFPRPTVVLRAPRSN
jgi:RNA recognition motif-containing protein